MYIPNSRVQMWVLAWAIKQCYAKYIKASSHAKRKHTQQLCSTCALFFGPAQFTRPFTCDTRILYPHLLATRPFYPRPAHFTRDPRILPATRSDYILSVFAVLPNSSNCKLAAKKAVFLGDLVALKLYIAVGPRQRLTWWQYFMAGAQFMAS